MTEERGSRSRRPKSTLADKPSQAPSEEPDSGGVQEPPRSEPELRTIAMPADTNAYGDIFGGWLLAQMDLAGGAYAIRRARGRVATVGIEAMSFHEPVSVGDQVSCYCCTERIGNTSITVQVETWARRRWGSHFDEAVKVTEGMFTFVGLNDDGTKRSIPKD